MILYKSVENSNLELPSNPLFYVRYENYKEITFTIRPIVSNSVFQEAFGIYLLPGFSGDVFVNGEKVHLSKSKWKNLIFWETKGMFKFWSDSQPEKEYVINIKIKKGNVAIDNGYDSDNHTENNNLYCETIGKLFILETISDNEFIMRCGNADNLKCFDDLVLYLKVELGEEMDL
ncbi:MAG: hypothetical protein IKU42_07875 [Oscillospiraceae bacterium]|nr:hypothetical protein [Oscillospiraceae bacterium]